MGMNWESFRWLLQRKVAVLHGIEGVQHQYFCCTFAGKDFSHYGIIVRDWYFAIDHVFFHVVE